MYLLDTAAWIEYLLDTPLGKKVDLVLEAGSCYTCIVSIAEIAHWAKREGRPSKKAIEGVRRLSTLINLNPVIAKRAGELNFERKKVKRGWGMVDSFILATARFYTLTVLTKDSHFDDLPDAEML